MLYVQYNPDTMQMIGTPANLPGRWTTPEGATISNFNTLPQAALFALGWAPVAYEPITTPEAFYYSLPKWDSESKTFIYAATPKDLAILYAQAEAEIDAAASAASLKYISAGAGQDMRYLVKIECAKAYLSAITAGEIPDAADAYFITAEAEVCGVAPEVKAREIIAAREAFVLIGARIEALRIGGKVKCRAAATGEILIAAKDEAVSALGEV